MGTKLKILKILITLLSVISIVIVTTIVIINYRKSDEYKIKKAYDLFGKEYCSYVYNPNNPFQIRNDGHSDIGCTSITEWKCKICGYKGESGTTITSSLCNECSKITNRCSKCGKLAK